MKERIDQELALLRSRREDVDYQAQGRWVRVFPISTAPGWSHERVAVAFQIPPGYPGTPPYGFYVSTDLTFRRQRPKNCRRTPSPEVPFEGRWMMLSWAHDGAWHPTADLVTGANLLNWVLSLSERFKMGR